MLKDRPLICINMDYQPGRWGKYILPENYYQAVLEQGGLPLAAPASGRHDDLLKIAEHADAFLFCGGDDYPAALYGQMDHPANELCHANRSGSDMILADLALESGKPILAICAGHQLMAIKCGGQLIQHLDSRLGHGKEAYHPAALAEGTRIAGILKSVAHLAEDGFFRVTVNSWHHQAVDPRSLPERFIISAIAADGTIEAMESRDEQWILSLQWHPERIDDREHRRLIFNAFISEARKAASSSS